MKIQQTTTEKSSSIVYDKWKKSIKKKASVKSKKKILKRKDIFQKELDGLKNKSYFDFLKSEYWNGIRKKILKRDNYKCTICYSTKDLQVHHTTYKNHFSEHKHLNDLITCCDKCHTNIHVNSSAKTKVKMEEKNIGKVCLRNEQQFNEWINKMASVELSPFLYVIECSENKYYVGVAYNLFKRFAEHYYKKKSCAVFTRIYPPIKYIHLFKFPTESKHEVEVYENIVTIHYAIKYGTGNVAGGNFVERDLFNRRTKIEQAIKTKKVNVHGKQYDIHNELILSKLRTSKIENLYGLTNEEISNTVINKIIPINIKL